MRTYVSPIGYDTRRVTRPVINHGVGPEDRVVLLRPETESDTERATQAIADVEQLLQEIEPELAMTVKRIPLSEFESAVLECGNVLEAGRGELVVSLGGGARDVLLPLTVAALVYARIVDVALFFSDIDGSVREWTLPELTGHVPERATNTLAEIEATDEPQSLSDLADKTDKSKSTIVRHVNELESEGVVESFEQQKVKYVTVSFTGQILRRASEVSADGSE